MRDEDEDFEDAVFNDLSGTAENSFQAGVVNGDVYFPSGSDDDSDDSSFVTGTVYSGAGIAFFVALFIVAAAYSQVFDVLHPGFWDWVKLVASSIALVVVFFVTEAAIFNRLFGGLRFFLSILVLLLGLFEGGHVEPVRKLGLAIGKWVIWRF